jgi:hypothetical protein
VGYDHAGHYYCHGCHEGGSAEWWLRKVEGKRVGWAKPDPEIQRERERRRVREKLISEFRDRYPECSVPDDFIST